MVPSKLCGLYTIISCTNPKYIGSELFIDYNHIHFTWIKKIGAMTIHKNMYGSVFVKDNFVKVQWVNSGSYEVDLIVLPLITYPYVKDNCKRMNCLYTVDETNTWITISHTEQYTLRKNTYPKKKEDTFIKIVFTQLLINYIINLLHQLSTRPTFY